MSKVIMFYTTKGGVGKSSLTHSVAGVLKYMGKSVLVLDADMQANISKYLDADQTEPSLFELMNAEVGSIDDVIQHLNGIDLIRGSEALSRCDKEFTEVDELFILEDLVEAFKKKYEYDYILIDTPPAKSYIVTASFIAADFIIVPTECDEGSIDGVKSVIGELDKLTTGKRTFSHAQLLAVVLNKFENTTLHDITKTRIENIVRDRQDNVIIEKVRKNIAMSECKNLKKTLQEYKKNSSAGRDVYRLTELIIERCEE